jgi:DegV family protein with EDD domain
VRIYFLVATLDFLARGGRIGGAAALVGSLLQIKPILTFREGKVDQFERERTYRRAFSRLAQIAIEQMPHDESAYPSVMHAGVPEEAQRMAAELAAASGISRIPILNLPPAIVTHGGPGMVGIGFFVKG